MQKCQDSIKATVKRVKSQIQRVPIQNKKKEKKARHDYKKIYDYLDALNKRIVMQQRAFACQSKAFAHMLQGEFYTMDNSILVRHEAEMNHLQPHLEQLGVRNLGTPPPPPPLAHSFVLV